MSDILMIDDDREMCVEMREILGDEGYEVALAHTGKEGLRQALSRDYSLILLDFKMPDLSGLDVLRALRAEKPQAPVLLLTGRPFQCHMDNDPAHRATNAELTALASAIINKPFDIVRVLAKIRELTGTTHVGLGPRRDT